MPNIKGANQFQQEKPYGAVKQLTRLTKAAPMSGAPTPALTAPARARQRATQPQTRQAAPMVAPPPPTVTPYPAQLAQVWQELARATPDPLVRYYADLAVRQAGG